MHNQKKKKQQEKKNEQNNGGKGGQARPGVAGSNPVFNRSIHIVPPELMRLLVHLVLRYHSQ